MKRSGFHMNFIFKCLTGAQGGIPFAANFQFHTGTAYTSVPVLGLSEFDFSRFR